MNCQDITGEQIGERYLTGKLEEALRDEFEVHILECPACLNSLETLQELRDATASRADQIRLAPDRRSFRLWSWSFAAAAALAVIFAIGQWRKHQESSAAQIAGQQQSASEKPVTPVPLASNPENSNTLSAPVAHAPVNQGTEVSKVAPAISKKQSTMKAVATQPVPQPAPPANQAASETSVQSAEVAVTPQPKARHESVDKQPELTSEQAVELYRLAQVRPAQFTFSGFKSSPGPSHAMGAMQGGTGRDSGSSTFQRGMDLYIEGNYHDASMILETAAEAEPGAPNVNFYLGVCRLLLGHPDDAIPALAIVATNPQSRLAQSAHLYLAKAYLQKADLKNAESELASASALPGPLKSEAAALRQRVHSLRTGVESASHPSAQ